MPWRPAPKRIRRTKEEIAAGLTIAQARERRANGAMRGKGTTS